MTFEDFCERFKGVRRSVLVICIIWTSVTIGFGLYALVSSGLSGPDATFLTAVVGLMQVPVAFYFQTRGKQ